MSPSGGYYSSLPLLYSLTGIAGSLAALFRAAVHSFLPKKKEKPKAKPSLEFFPLLSFLKAEGEAEGHILLAISHLFPPI